MEMNFAEGILLGTRLLGLNFFKNGLMVIKNKVETSESSRFSDWVLSIKRESVSYLKATKMVCRI